VVTVARTGCDAVVEDLQEMVSELQAGAEWENDTLIRYLEALGAWIADCPGYYANNGRAVPSDGWEVIRDALKAAKIYE